MIRDSLIENKSVEFAINVVKLGKALMNEKREYILSKQLIRSGTSIGAQVFEARFAQSRADFIHKMSVALKEANESYYWIYLLYKTSYIKNNEYNNLRKMANSIISILSKIILTTKRKED